MSTNDADTTPPKTLAERVEFDVIATDQNGERMRIWTVGDKVEIHCERGVHTVIPRNLFILAAQMLVTHCESTAREDHDVDWSEQEGLWEPAEMAMALRIDAGPEHDDLSDCLRFGFGDITIAVALDQPPHALRRDP